MNPFLVEFTGLPESGKTTCIKTISERFVKIGLKVKYIQESAEIISDTNIPKGSFEAHLSMRLLTIFNIIKSNYDDYDLILIDRGLLDGILYTEKFLADNPDKSIECTNLINLIRGLEQYYPDLLILFKVDPKVAIQRKGHEGSIVNMKFLNEYSILMDDFRKNLTCQNICIDTTFSPKEKISDLIFNLVSEYSEKG